MRKIIIMILLSFVTFSHAYKFMNISNIQGLRANGSNAVYWNPSTINKGNNFYKELEFLGFSFNTGNNSFSIKTYNKYNGTHITDSDKDDIMKKLKDNLNLFVFGNFKVFGFSWSNRVISFGITGLLNGKLDKKYIDIILNGNANHYNDPYSFNKNNNNFGGLLFYDFTYGHNIGIIQELIPKMKSFSWLPDIWVGYSFSFLQGIVNAELKEFDGELITNDDSGIVFSQEIKIREGSLGIGFKGGLGLSAEVIENLNVGLSLDNLFGFINWNKKTQEKIYTLKADSVFFADLDKDVLVEKNKTVLIDKYSISLPTVLRMSLLWKYGIMDYSIDWQKSIQKSVFYSSNGSLSLATSCYYLKKFPLTLGFVFGNASQSYSLGYSFGYRGDFYCFDVGLQSYNSIIPNSSSEGISFFMNNKIRF